MSFNVLVTAVSRRVGLVRAFRHALDSLCPGGSVIGTDVNALSPAVHFCDRAYEVPLSSDPTYLETIVGLCERERISLVVPTIDEELPIFGEAVGRFAAKGVRVSVVPREDADLIDLTLACARVFRFHGPVNVQCRTVGGRPTVFEINPRFSGGMPLTIAAGADFPRMLLEPALGSRVEPSIGRFRRDLWMTSYESSLFLDANHVNRLRPAEEARPVVIEAIA